MIKQNGKWTRIPPELERAFYAHHEAGHVVMHYLKKVRFAYVTINGTMSERPDVKSFVCVNPISFEKRKKVLEREFLLDMAGTIAEKIYLKSKGYEVCPGYTKSDLRLIMNKAEKYFGITEPDVIDKKLKELEPECKNLIEQNCKAITAIVEALLKEETIGYKKAREIIKRIK